LAGLSVSDSGDSMGGDIVRRQRLLAADYREAGNANELAIFKRDGR
jgi:hypothetical protein